MAGWPAGGTAAITAVTDAGYSLQFSGAHQGTDVDPLSVTNGTGGAAGTVAEATKGTPGILPAGATAHRRRRSAAPAPSTTPGSR